MELKSKVIKWIMGAGFLAASSIVMVNEGYKETSYKDGAGVWTICYGETKGVTAGMKKTRAQCDAQLRKSIETHSRALQGLPDSTPMVVALGSLDMAYNIGETGFNNSSAKRYLMAGDYVNAGKAVLSWKYITRWSKTSPGKLWVRVKGTDRWRLDCSIKGNKVCEGLWKRRLIQADMIGNKISVEEALRRLNAN